MIFKECLDGYWVTGDRKKALLLWKIPFIHNARFLVCLPAIVFVCIRLLCLLAMLYYEAAKIVFTF